MKPFCALAHIKWNTALLKKLAKDTFWRIMDRIYTTSGGLHESSFNRNSPFTHAMYPIFGQIGREWGCIIHFEREYRLHSGKKRWSSDFKGNRRRHDIDWDLAPKAEAPFQHTEYENTSGKLITTINKLWDSNATHLLIGMGYPSTNDHLIDAQDLIVEKVARHLDERVLMMIYDSWLFSEDFPDYLIGFIYTREGWQQDAVITATRIHDKRGYLQISRVREGKSALRTIKKNIPDLKLT